MLTGSACCAARIGRTCQTGRLFPFSDVHGLGQSYFPKRVPANKRAANYGENDSRDHVS